MGHEGNDNEGKAIMVVFFASENGNEPVRKWLKEKLTAEQRQAVGEDIAAIEFGWGKGVPMSILQKLDKEIWEVRTRFKEGIARVLFAVDEDKMILLEGFVKKSQKTPKERLTTAKQRLAQYREQKMANKHLGSSFDGFLKEEGIYAITKSRGEKKFLVFQILNQMKKKGLTKVEMARRMKTSRSELARILDPDNKSVTWESIEKAAAAVGKTLCVKLVDAAKVA